MEESKQCPNCGKTEFGQGILKGHARIFPSDKFFSNGSDVVAEICTSCGYILYLWVANPKAFK